MNRPRRIILNLLTGLSLLLCVATVALWLLPGRTGKFIWTTGRHKAYGMPVAVLWELNVDRGHLCVTDTREWRGHQHLRWVRDGSDIGPFWRQRYANRPSVITRRFAIIEMRTIVTDIAMNQWQHGYIDDLDGTMPLSPNGMPFGGNFYPSWAYPSTYQLGPVRRQTRIPCSAIAAMFALFPVLRLVQSRWSSHRRRLQSSRGLCPVCNYDLRATPTRCPECGTATH